MRISDVFAMGGHGGDDSYYDDYEGATDNPCYNRKQFCIRPTGPFNYGPRGDRKGLAHILGSVEGGGLLGIFRRAGHGY
ncbi:MAG TPA: hypothetical protein VFO16_22270 [Pseudonocardiaceae bacterium]|nr:hypothetical protein [Pseudonocardiaceae bacterium]